MKNVFNLRKWGFIVSRNPSLTICGGREEHVNSLCSPFIKKNTIVLLYDFSESNNQYKTIILMLCYEWKRKIRPKIEGKKPSAHQI